MPGAGLISSARRRSAGGDPNFATVVLLLGMDGANGSTTFTDESFAARGNAALGGNAQVSTAAPKFGTGALLLDGVGDAIGYADSNDWQWVADFTLEGWFYFDSGFIGVSTQILASQWDANSNRSWILQLTSGGLLQFAISTTTANTIILHSVSWTPTANTWYHVAVDRSGNTWRLYRDGTMLATATNSGTPANCSAALRIGCSISSAGANTAFMKGQVDEFRINDGHAYYASDAGYSVPTGPFPRS